ncbi:aminotransferase class V-fold PLP-dependent enzyme [Muricauda sp. JGD-17]|uniref:Aminotransferase class V-fold PLP-dependent enzyme n=1 Tax=Flagellimonas ochracea TaxID=2696472 RepID=A0A964WWT7_9FLAO|nr:aminotransferase class V-fold PLP-dependent enzyme [Allomuricauda ochracea]NAY91421.1 aminotransferase class V-fold PLP-dependent enzyme [Allomuricauda ochracea]
MAKRDLKTYFGQFRKHIIGQHEMLKISGKERPMVYADWTASGRLYWPIEETMLHKVGPWVANTHTETSLTGATMTRAYRMARERIKKHVNANNDDVLIPCGTGMTGALAKLQRIMGLTVPEQLQEHIRIPEQKRPMVWVSHMEHHSNHTSWLETLCEVVVVPYDITGRVNLAALEHMMACYPDRRKIVAITACSNVTGIETPYHTIAGIAHRHGGICIVDFAASAPYVDIDMHPSDTHYLDAITFSPHKFLGGPGSTGIIIFNKKLYNKKVPDVPGGGTVTFTDPWGNHLYKPDIEEREDGGTPGFLQTIRAALAIKLKEQMGTAKMKQREQEINELVFEQLQNVEGLKLLASQHKLRLSIFSFTIEGLHYDMVTRLLNDRFGIQARGGCSCAGTYGHYLMDIDPRASEEIRKQSEEGCALDRPGWTRVSFHPTTADWEVLQVCHAIRSIVKKGHGWAKEYTKTPTGFIPDNKSAAMRLPVESWFEGCCKPELDLNLS